MSENGKKGHQTEENEKELVYGAVLGQTLLFLEPGKARDLAQHAG